MSFGLKTIRWDGEKRRILHFLAVGNDPSAPLDGLTALMNDSSARLDGPSALMNHPSVRLNAASDPLNAPSDLMRNPSARLDDLAAPMDDSFGRKIEILTSAHVLRQEGNAFLRLAVRRFQLKA